MPADGDSGHDVHAHPSLVRQCGNDPRTVLGVLLSLSLCLILIVQSRRTGKWWLQCPMGWRELLGLKVFSLTHGRFLLEFFLSAGPLNKLVGSSH